MTATDELRAELTKRGVEWKAPASFDGTARYDTTAGGYWFHEFDGKITIHGLTPAQAIAATLGSGTCQLKRASWDDGTCTWGCICSACDAHLEHETGIGYNYCPICGRRIVEVDE